MGKKEFLEIENIIIEYVKKGNRPLQRKKERALQAKQCRRMLHEIDFIVHKKLKPFFENIKDQYEIEARAFTSFLKPVKMGRPYAKISRKVKAS
ncbi:MAG: hypothetical protein JJE25_13175 [Bacteroidia bacterium]|nr:hypothetical protein [Bacteroidia bacterium]